MKILEGRKRAKKNKEEIETQKEENRKEIAETHTTLEMSKRTHGSHIKKRKTKKNVWG